MEPKYPMRPPRPFAPGRPFVLGRPLRRPADGPSGSNGAPVVRPAGEGDEDDGEGPAAPRPPAILTIEIGEARFAAGLMTTAGELIDRTAVMADPDGGPEAHFGMVSDIVEQQRQEANERHRVRLIAVGVSCAGPMTPNVETVSPVTLPSWRNFPLRQRLRELTELRVFGDYEGKALALAEGWHGAAKGTENYALLTVSRSIDGGVVSNGRLLDGAHGRAGNLAHCIVEPNGRRCPCGARGCLEAEASGQAVEAITGRSHNEPTYEIMQRTGRYVGRAAAQWANLLDLDLVVVGGSVALGFAATFFNAAQEELSTLARSRYCRQARITPTRLGDTGPLIGAGAVAVRGIGRARAARARR